MSELKTKTWSMPSADLGSENPLPPLLNDQELHIGQRVDPAVPGEIRQNLTYGHLPNILPCAMQDGYNRERKPLDFRVAVLENELLRATFLLELGRMRLLETRARLALGQIDQAGEIIETLPVIEDIREGELSLSQLWLEYNVQRLSRQENCPITAELVSQARQQFPLPASLDFRMTDDDSP